MKGKYKKEKARLFCEGHAGKKRFYKEVLDEWKEEGVGTEDVKFIVSIKEGFSFDRLYDVRVKEFNTVQKAIDSIKTVYTHA